MKQFQKQYTIIYLRFKMKSYLSKQQMRPTPPHLTSAAAESLLAQACENESQNAKRMRLGLEPLPVSRFENYAKRVSPIGNT